MSLCSLPLQNLLENQVDEVVSLCILYVRMAPSTCTYSILVDPSAAMHRYYALCTKLGRSTKVLLSCLLHSHYWLIPAATRPQECAAFCLTMPAHEMLTRPFTSPMPCHANSWGQPRLKLSMKFGKSIQSASRCWLQMHACLLRHLVLFFTQSE